MGYSKNCVSNEAKEWVWACLNVGILFALMMMAFQVFAADGTEFQEATEKVEGWLQGYLGKLAAFIALAIGAIMAAIKKDWTWFMGAVVLSMGIGILIGIVNASFTATI